MLLVSTVAFEYTGFNAEKARERVETWCTSQHTEAKMVGMGLRIDGRDGASGFWLLRLDWRKWSGRFQWLGCDFKRHRWFRWDQCDRWTKCDAQTHRAGR